MGASYVDASYTDTLYADASYTDVSYMDASYMDLSIMMIIITMMIALYTDDDECHHYDDHIVHDEGDVDNSCIVHASTIYHPDQPTNMPSLGVGYHKQTSPHI